jgi:hypothetical protein
MFFDFALTVPANTPASAPLEQLVTLVGGEITWWQIQFPRGCVGLVHVKVRDELHQVIPINSDGDVSGDDQRIDTFDSIVLNDDPFNLRLVGWNDDDSYPHTITFRFAVRSEAEIKRLASAFRALDFLDKWFSQQTPTPAR